MTESIFDPECRLCAREHDEEPKGGWVYRDAYWSVGILDGYEAPGWLVAQARRHVIGTYGLDESEQESLGPLLARLSKAAIQVTGAEKVYIVTYGENFPHLHFLLMTRGVDVPPSHRGAHFTLNKEIYLDPVKAGAIAARLREVLSIAAKRVTSS